MKALKLILLASLVCSGMPQVKAASEPVPMTTVSGIPGSAGITQAVPQVQPDAGKPAEAQKLVSLSDEDEEAWREFVRMLKRLPTTVVQSFFMGVALNEGKKFSSQVCQAAVAGTKYMASSAMHAAAYLGAKASQATAQGVTSLKNGTVLAQAGNYVGSYGQPESAEALYDAVQVISTLPTNSEWLQQHATTREGAILAAVAVGTVVTYMALKKVIQQYKKK